MIARLVLVGVAVAAALVPLAPERIEHLYSTSLYPRVQQAVTAATNRVPFALLDLAGGALLLLFLASFVARARRRNIRHAAARGALSVATTAAIVYLWFLGAWGLNYRRVPLEAKLDYDAGRATRAAAVAFASSAVARVNDGYVAAHAGVADDRALERAFADAQRLLGSTRLAVPGRPKRSLLTFYFRRAAIDGMTDPFFLEIILNADVLAVERPFVLAHEWAHLAGFADESEANFVAWVTCARGDAVARYSGWLAAYQHTVAAVPRDARAAVPLLAEGPRADLRAIAERYRRSSPLVRHAARDVYDSYLKANRVDEGIASYDAVARLLIATRFDRDWRPVLR